MLTASKIIILSAAAILSVSTASAADTTEGTINATFRYVRADSVEKNYAAFKLTAKRACDAMSSLVGLPKHRECMRGLVAQAVTATKVNSFIAYHQNRASNIQTASAAR